MNTPIEPNESTVTTKSAQNAKSKGKAGEPLAEQPEQVTVSWSIRFTDEEI